MRIFGKERQSLRLKAVKASRAVYNSPDSQDIEIELVTEDGERLVLQMPPRLANKMVTEVANAYEAINPPLLRGSRYAQWEGMNDGGG